MNYLKKYRQQAGLTTNENSAKGASYGPTGASRNRGIEDLTPTRQTLDYLNGMLNQSSKASLQPIKPQHNNFHPMSSATQPGFASHQSSMTVLKTPVRKRQSARKNGQTATTPSAAKSNKGSIRKSTTPKGSGIYPLSKVDTNNMQVGSRHNLQSSSRKSLKQVSSQSKKGVMMHGTVTTCDIQGNNFKMTVTTPSSTPFQATVPVQADRKRDVKNS